MAGIIRSKLKLVNDILFYLFPQMVLGKSRKHGNKEDLQSWRTP
jgi:hypothetical protein